MKSFKKALMIMCIFLVTLSSRVYGLDIDYICGSDRYETAAMIASKLSYSSAILVNGTALVDGLSASGLSGATNSPILLTRTDEIPNTTLQKLQSSNKVYIVGGTSVVSKSIEDKLKGMGKEVVRLGGNTRFETSQVVANAIENIKGLQEIYYVNGLRGEADAMSIAPVAAKTGNPVILTDGVSTEYRKLVKCYTIGGTTVLSYIFDEFSERIGGSTRFETNKEVVLKFFNNRDHVNLSKADTLVDALTVSSLKQPVILISNESNKNVIAGSKSATVLGGISDVAVSRAKAYLYGDAVVFYVQHQDDETLFAGSAVVDAIKSVGKENVYIVLITDGSGSGVFDWPRYDKLKYEEKVALRNNEFKAAIVALGVDLSNVTFLEQYNEIMDENGVREKILYFENNFENVTHVTHSYKYETHPHHIASGELVLSLYKQGLIKDCRFMARYDKISSVSSKDLIESIADDVNERTAVVDACNEYKLDNKNMIREGIGYKSVQSLFDNLLSSSNVPSYLHGPGI